MGERDGRRPDYAGRDSLTDEFDAAPRRRRATLLATLGRDHEGPVNPPVDRFSTVCFPTMRALREAGQHRYEPVASYGTQGGGVQFRLAGAIAALEGGTETQLAQNGLAAITLALLATLSAGDQMLLVDSAYGPARRLADEVLGRLGIGCTVYDPSLAPDVVGSLFTPRTRLLLTESPGSNTFEMQDVAALAAVAHRRGALLAFDNTWGFGCFEPFRHGVDLSIQALTKYPAGHADLLLGAVTVNEPLLWRRLRDTALALGMTAPPDDCWLALRGLRTLDVRLERQFRSGLAVARHCAGRPEVARVRHPALPGAPGHELWRRDYGDAAGGASLFGLEFVPGIGTADVDRFVDRLALFAKGWSWGGFESLATTVTGNIRRDHPQPDAGAMCRLHVGLEDPADLIADLDGAWAVLQAR